MAEFSDALLRAAGLPSAASLWQPDPIVKAGKPGRLLHNRTVTARLVAATLPFLSKPPPSPIRTATRPTPLEVRCDGEFWAGRRAVPAEIVDVFMFAWQLDLLEVRLFELEHVVDAFVIWEGLFGQRGIEKPLVLAANMHRFARFRHKISYVVQDDLDFRTMLSAQRADGKLGKVWAAELGRGGLKLKSEPGQDWVNEDHRRDAALRWVKTTNEARRGGGGGAPPRERLFVFSDLDELPRAEALLALKHCVPRADGGRRGQRVRPPLRLPLSVFLFDFEHRDKNAGGLNYNAHVLTDPAAQTTRYSEYPRAPPSLGVGTHLNRCVTPAEFFLKTWLQAESTEWRADADVPRSLDLLAWYKKGRRGRLRDFGAPVSARDDPNRTYIPWFIAHNRARFPYLFPSEFPDGLRHYTTL